MKFIRIFLLAFSLCFWGVAAADEPVNINTATAEELADALNGVGMAKATAIVKYREANGYFNSVDQLVDVKGIGAKTVEKLRNNIELDVPLDHELKKKGAK